MIFKSETKRRAAQLGHPVPATQSLRARAVTSGRFVRRSLADRFWLAVEKTDACWLWKRGTTSSGYGHIRGEDNGRHVMAHRVSWELANGPIPAGLLVLHKCDNPPCVNPAHLFLGTNQDNSDDKMAKGRGNTGERSGASKLTWEQVHAIRAMKNQAGMRNKDIAKVFGLGTSTVQAITSGKSWREALELAKGKP